jgi:hypothetical protein
VDLLPGPRREPHRTRRRADRVHGRSERLVSRRLAPTACPEPEWICC